MLLSLIRFIFFMSAAIAAVLTSASEGPTDSGAARQTVALGFCGLADKSENKKKVEVGHAKYK